MGGRRLKTYIPPIQAESKWARYAIEAMREIARDGRRAWLERELETPSHPTDPDWCEFIVRESQGEPHPKSKGSLDVTYRCPDCKDTDFTYVRQGKIQRAKRCPWCQAIRDDQIRATSSRSDERKDIGEPPTKTDLPF